MEIDDKRIEDFIKAVEEIFSGMDPKTFWPLNGGQIDAYFDVVESLDMYHRLNSLREKLSVKEIAELMPPADVIRLFLQHNAVIGLKVAKKLGIAFVSAEDRTKYLLLLLGILQQKVKNDVFCLGGKNLLLDESEVQQILSETKWNLPNSLEEKKQIAVLAVSASNLCYALFYDIFMAGGFYLHGPYNVEEKFGKDAIMLVREFHNLNPLEIWPDLKMPCSKMRVFCVYKNLDLKINFANHPLSTATVGDKLVAYKVLLDGQEVKFNQIPELIEQFQKITSNQVEKINALNDLDKARKGAEIAFYLFKRLREHSGDNWKPPEQVEKNIQDFGDKFIKQFQYEKKPSLEHWKKLFDPRNDYY